MIGHAITTSSFGGYNGNNARYPKDESKNLEVIELLDEAQRLKEEANNLFSKRSKLLQYLENLGIDLLPFKNGDDVFLVGAREGWHRVEKIQDCKWSILDNSVEARYYIYVRELGKKRQPIGRSFEIFTYINKCMNGTTDKDVSISEIKSN